MQRAFLFSFPLGQAVAAQVFSPGKYIGCLGQKAVAVSVGAPDMQRGQGVLSTRRNRCHIPRRLNACTIFSMKFSPK